MLRYDPANRANMAKNRFSKNWLYDHINDPYVKLAQQKGYRARAAFKLTEILDTEKLLKPGNIVIDLGSAPGSWSQIVRERMVGPQGVLRGRIIALDLLPMEPVAGVEFILGDFREDAVLKQLEALLGNQQVDLVISDMAPNLSGVESADSARIQHVCDLAREFSERHLKADGALIVKAFHGSGFSQIVQTFKQSFRRVVERKPKASRDKSSETFLVATGLKSPSVLQEAERVESGN
jgi:23S rRNA (uridine2552-2'-O)-methyltransferase